VATERCIVAALERCAAFPCFCARLGASVRARFPGGFHRMNELEQELKRLLIEVLNLEDITVEQIDSQAPLFGDGLGLDSIDALELGVAIRRKYDVRMDAAPEIMRKHFASIANLARFVSGTPDPA